ncbi:MULTISPECIES: hypothetical protein [unclassified Chryseobacterium]|uniref:hypothetical protein n=1 Tax=unclassified Chryseobacterium TaxID=2593645 RepID=UPI00285316E8|nr:hypothetical protein [Chryseobacterium sp. CFS7]MDR4892287.1 hypothetical protein [Chryseobacterium sp. CFS7]
MDISIEGVVAICGGSSAVISGVVGFAAQRWADKRNNEWRAKTDTELKKLESELSEKTSILNNLINIQKDNYSASHQRRLEAIEKVWVSLESVKCKISPTIAFVYDGITEAEIEDLNSDNPTKSSIFIINQLKGIDYDSIFIQIQDFKKVIFCERPFLGDDLYVSLNVYTIFLGRIANNTMTGISFKEFKHWHKDEPAINLLTDYFNEKEVQYLKRQTFFSYQLTIEMFESKIIDMIKDIMSGKVASTDSLTHIINFKKILETTNTAP